MVLASISKARPTGVGVWMGVADLVAVGATVCVFVALAVGVGAARLCDPLWHFDPVTTRAVADLAPRQSAHLVT